MTSHKGVENEIDKEGNLCLQFGCRKGETALITHSNKLECSDYSQSLLQEIEKAKKQNRNLMIPRDLLMTKFVKERGETQNMAEDSFAFIPNFKTQNHQATQKKLEDWSEKV